MSALETPAAVEPRLDRVAAENARLVREARTALLTDAPSVTIEMLAEGRDASIGSVRQWLHRNRKAHRLVTVEHGNRALVPTFQLDEAFDLDPMAADAIVTLTRFGMGPWAIWNWFHVPNGWIDEPPAEALARGDRDALERAVAGLVDA